MPQVTWRPDEEEGESGRVRGSISYSPSDRAQVSIMYLCVCVFVFVCVCVWGGERQGKRGASHTLLLIHLCVNLSICVSGVVREERQVTVSSFVFVCVCVC